MMIPYMVGKLAPNPTHSTRGLVKYVPGRGYFRAVPSQNGDKIVTSPPPPQSLNGSFVLGTNLRVFFFKENEYPPVREEKVKTFRWDHRLQIQTLFMAFRRVPRG